MGNESRDPDKRNVNTWMGSEDREILAWLAKMFGTTKSDVMRTAIHMLYKSTMKEKEEDERANRD